jgi:hypothetical protein
MIIREDNNDKFINEFQSSCYSIFSYLEDLEEYRTKFSDLWTGNYLGEYDLDNLSEQDKKDILYILQRCFADISNITNDCYTIDAMLKGHE